MYLNGTSVKKHTETVCTYLSNAILALCIPEWPLHCVIILDTESGDKNVLLKG